MIRAILFAVLLGFGSSISFADEEETPRQIINPVDPKEELAETLEEFIGRAVDEGLLDRAEDPSKQIPGLEEGGLPVNCTPIFGLDFDPLHELTKFEDLYTIKESVGTLPRTEEMKIRIALGLYSEARALRGPIEPESSYLINLAVLLENYESPDVAFFEDFSDCGVIGRFWHAVAQLSVHDRSGVGVIRESVIYFRSLPIQMRVDLATIIIPALDGFGERLLANKLMTTFSEDEAKDSSSLQFSLALLDGDPDTDIGDFIVRPEFRSKALRAIVQRDTELSEAQRDLLLEEFTRIIKSESDERRITIGLKFALREYSKRSDVAQMIELAKIPNLQSPAAMNTILQHVAKVIEQGLESEDQLVVLSAIQSLIDHAETLDFHPATAGLYPVAAQYAEKSGYRSLAARLSDRGLRRTESLLQMANLAYREGSANKLNALAREYPDIAEISLLAAKAALNADNAASLREFEVKLIDHPKLALELAQQDAIQGKWSVSEAIYIAAAIAQDEDLSGRAQNLLTLRRSATSNPQRPDLNLRQADEILSRSSQNLRPEKERTN